MSLIAELKRRNVFRVGLVTCPHQLVQVQGYSRQTQAAE
jgi:hypothetical protein